METDGPHNQGGSTERDPGGKVLQFPGEWYGPHEELVPFGPAARWVDDPADDAAPGTQTQQDIAQLSADGFWDGELVQFPAVPSRIRRRRWAPAAAAAAVLCLAVIAVRVWAGATGGAGSRPAPVARIATSGTESFGQQLRMMPARPLSAASRQHHAAQRHPHSATRAHGGADGRPGAPGSGSPVTVGRPVVYSTPAPTQPTALNDTSSSGGGSAAGGGGTSSAGSGSSSSRPTSGGSAGGGSHGGGSRRSGPVGPGAAFGPGQMGG